MRASEFLFEDASQLNSLVAQDQQERNQYQQFVNGQTNGDWETGAKLWAEKHNRPEDDVFGDKQRLNQFMKMQFKFDTFSKSDWHNYWLLAQHCDFDRNFQKQALANILKYVGKESEEYKYLYDRIQCGQEGTQTFGTQDICNKD